MIAALSTGHKVGLIVVAAVFIGFALISSFVLPRRQPDFPGDKLKVFVGATVALFIAMLAAVVVFGSEPKEKRRAEEGGGATTAQTATTAGSGGGASAAGDASHGQALFTSKGCTGCHSISGQFLAGPALNGVAGSDVTLADGSKVKADDAYLLESIEDPGAKVVKCPNCGPPTPMLAAIAKGSVAHGDAQDLVAYIDSLK